MKKAELSQSRGGQLHASQTSSDATQMLTRVGILVLKNGYGHLVPRGKGGTVDRIGVIRATMPLGVTVSVVRSTPRCHCFGLH